VKRRVSACTHTDTKSTYSFIIDISDKHTKCSVSTILARLSITRSQIELEVILAAYSWKTLFSTVNLTISLQIEKKILATLCL